MVFVGEAPGRHRGSSSAGPSSAGPGKLLDELLAEAGLVRADVWITNVVKARPPKNRDPKAPEIAHWMPWLEREIELIEPRLIVPLGPARAEALRARGEDRRGPRDACSASRLFPLYHPAAAMYNQTLRETLFEDARALGVLLRE